MLYFFKYTSYIQLVYRFDFGKEVRLYAFIDIKDIKELCYFSYGTGWRKIE